MNEYLNVLVAFVALIITVLLIQNENKLLPFFFSNKVVFWLMVLIPSSIASYNFQYVDKLIVQPIIRFFIK